MRFQGVGREKQILMRIPIDCPVLRYARKKRITSSAHGFESGTRYQHGPESCGKHQSRLRDFEVTQRLLDEMVRQDAQAQSDRDGGCQNPRRFEAMRAIDEANDRPVPEVKRIRDLSHVHDAGQTQHTHGKAIGCSAGRDQQSSGQHGNDGPRKWEMGG